jgi:hypothetical protein
MAKFGKALIESMKQAAEPAAGDKARAEPIGKSAKRRRTGKGLIAEMHASPHGDLNIEPRRTPMRVRKVSL